MERISLCDKGEAGGKLGAVSRPQEWRPMARLSKYRVLISGVLSPVVAVFLYGIVYVTLTRLSTDREKDWLLRLSLSTLAMTVPFLVTLALAIKDRRLHAISIDGKVGLALAILSLGLSWKPVSDGIARWKQERNMALRDVAAPPFATLDLLGKTQRLADQKGKVVLVISGRPGVDPAGRRCRGSTSYTGSASSKG
jgi:hypothetical protein